MRQKNLEMIISSAKETLGIGRNIQNDSNHENRLMISSQESEYQKGYLCGSDQSIEQNLQPDDEVPQYIRPHLNIVQRVVANNSNYTSTTLKVSKRSSKGSNQHSPIQSNKYFQKMKNFVRINKKEITPQVSQIKIDQEETSKKKQIIMTQYQKLMVHFHLRRFIKRFQVTKSKEVSHSQKLFLNDKSYYHYEEEKPITLPYNRLMYTLKRSKTYNWKTQIKRCEFKAARVCQALLYFSIVKRTLQLLNSLPIIQAESNFKIIWDFVMMSIRLYFMFAIPMQLGFSNNFLYHSAVEFTIVALFFLYSDIFVNFNTAYFELGQRVTERKLIIKNYLQNYLFFDLISYLTLTIFLIEKDQVFETNYYSFALLLFFSQILHIQSMFAKFEEQMSVHRQFISFLKLMQVLIVVLFIEHVFSCIWYFVGAYELNSGKQSWITHFDVDHQDFSNQYITSFYYACVTMMTVGYGDIAPITNLERMVCVVFMFISCVQLSYSVSTVGQIIIELSASQKELRQKLRTFNQYMQKKKISYQLQFEIRQYLSYYLQQQSSEETLLQQKLIVELSDPLRERLLLESNSLILQDCLLFKEHFSMEFKKRLIRLVQDTMAFPNGFIGPKDSIGEDLYFVENGKVHVYVEGLENDSHRIQILEAGQSFGVMSFISGQKSDYKFRSSGFTKLLLIRRDDFIQLIKEFPEDQEEFFQIKEKMTLYGELENFNQLCQVCQQTHKIQSCPKIHYPIDKEGLIKRFNFNIEQKRDLRFQRNTKRPRSYFHSRVDLNFYSEVIDCYRVQNESSVKQYEELQDQEEYQTEESENESNSINDYDSVISISPTNKQQISHQKSHQMKTKSLNKNLNQYQWPQNEDISVSPPILNINILSTNTNLHGRRQSTRVDILRGQKSLQYIGGTELNMIQEARFAKNFKNQKTKMIPTQEEIMIKMGQQLSHQRELLTRHSMKDFDLMQELLLRLKSVLNKERPLEFECKRDYQKYFVHNNPSIVIDQCNRSSIQHSQQLSVYKQFINYMLYPTIYFRMYKTAKKVVLKKSQSVMLKSRKTKTFSSKKTQVFPFK